MALLRPPHPSARAQPLLYTELFEWWPLLSPPADYAKEAAFYADVMCRLDNRPLRAVLELGSGGGNNAAHLKKDFDLTLVDLSSGMVEVSKRLNPECSHHVGDMRSVRLDQKFDGVFVHDAISYLATTTDVVETAHTIREHLVPGGVFLLVPDFVRETFTPATDCGGHDDHTRGLRYLSWTWDPDPDDHTFFTDYAYLLRHSDGHTTVHQDRHVEGLFAEAEWLELLATAGLHAEFITHHHDDAPIGSRLVGGRSSA